MTEPLSEQEISEISNQLLHGWDFRLMPMALKKRLEDAWPRLVNTNCQQAKQLVVLRGLLKELEWCYDGHRCPVCFASGWFKIDTDREHHPHCEMETVIRQLEE